MIWITSCCIGAGMDRPARCDERCLYAVERAELLGLAAHCRGQIVRAAVNRRSSQGTDVLAQLFDAGACYGDKIVQVLSTMRFCLRWLSA